MYSNSCVIFNTIIHSWELALFFFLNGVRRGGAKVKKMAEWKWHKKATQNRATFTLFQDKNKYSKM